MMINHVKLLVLFVIVQYASGQDLMCCSHATGSCRTICEEISLVEIAADVAVRHQTLLDVQKVCSAQLVQFWECLNATIEEMSQGDSWSGRVCCSRTYSESCRRACITATTAADLFQGCRKSDEIALFMCVDLQSQGEKCCGLAGSPPCNAACLDIFRSRLTPTRLQRTALEEACEIASPEVLKCVANFVRVTPMPNSSKYIACCDRSNLNKCRDACHAALTPNNNTVQEMLDIMQVGGCGPPLLQDPLYQCLLQSMDGPQTSVKLSIIDRVGLDSAKLHCCQKASTSICRKLCSKTFTKDWSMLWEEFHFKCLSDVAEEELRSCIDEVDEPCELGCDGLSFCTNFNNRPTELFRSCTPQADEAARNDVDLWQSQRELTLPGLTLPLKNISECSPNTWKAVACTLQIKPCSRHSHANQICRDVCLQILSQCIDWTRISPTYSPAAICATLSSEDACVSLDSFLTPSNKAHPAENQVSSPCKGDPCNVNQTCRANKNCRPGEPGEPCLPYKCEPGCRMGEVSEYVVPEGAFVRIPIPNRRECLQICKCTRGGIDQCQPLPCVTLSGCWMATKQQKEHGEVFYKDCNKCTCYAGEVVCSKKQCLRTALEGINAGHTTLPCNCPTHYVPVCGRNGVIYPSACIAKCAGLSDSEIDYGACQDPCRSNPCSVGKKCVPDSKICLSLMHKPCTQYQCINGTAQCGHLSYDPVCDTHNKQHDNSCLLAHSNSKLAYRGPCLLNCKNQGEVCGINGKTYISECAAYADYALVDYTGPCVTIGLIADQKTIQCSNIQCKPLPDESCLGLTPPGACCPVCGGMLRILYSKKQIDRALYALQSKSTNALTLRAMLKSLERHVQVAQCSLSGYITIELDIFVIVQSTARNPSGLQLEACVREAEKLANLINRRSPRIVSELSLSSLISASVVHVHYNSGASTVSTFWGFLLLPYYILIIYVKYHW